VRPFVLASVLVLAALAAPSAVPRAVPLALAAPQWHTLPNAPDAERIDALWFIDAKTGWVGDGNGFIHRTDDGGETWQQQFWNSALYFRCMTFGDAQTGYAGALSSTHTLHRTTDGGATWTLVTNLPNPKPNALCGIWAPTPLVAYGVGSYSGPARVIKTTNGGETWTSKDLSAQASTLVDVYFWNDRDGIIIGGVGTFPNQSRAVVLATTNGGASWQERYVGTRLGEWGWKISFPTPDTGYVSLERQNAPMYFLKTVNRGQTWTELPFVDENEQGIGFATTQLGWIGGWNNPTYQTNDGGATWAETPWGEYLDRFQFLTPTYGFAAGRTVYRYSEQTVAVGPGPGERAKPAVHALPNPFGPRTTIAYVLARPGAVTLLIADPAGRIVRRLAEMTQDAGPHRIDWDGRDDAGRETPAGIYLYVLHAGEQHEMGKLVRVR
jgi:photosystem II stability/assembly factor-like uncharacterized protein